MLPHLPSQGRVEFAQEAVALPAVEIVADSRVRRQIVRQVAPRTAGMELIAEPIENLAERMATVGVIFEVVGGKRRLH